MRTPTLPRVRSLHGSRGQGGALDRRIASKNGGKLEKVCRLCRKNRGGAAAVEFAVVVPVFFLMVFGMIEFGRMVMVQQVITNGSREGARIAVLDGTTGDDVEASVTTYLEGSQVFGATVSVDPTEPSSAGYGEPVTVTVTIPFGQVSWLPSPMFIGGDTVLTATSVMRRETVQ
jgi:Flp pilus assembly protein TadG